MPLFFAPPDIANQTKLALARFLNRRITVSAVVSCYGKTPTGRLVMAVEQVYHDGDLVADHLWIPTDGKLRTLRLAHGEWFRFEGRVIRYVKRSHPNLFHYGFDDIRSPERLIESDITHE